MPKPAVLDPAHAPVRLDGGVPGASGDVPSDVLLELVAELDSVCVDVGDDRVQTSVDSVLTLAAELLEQRL